MIDVHEILDKEGPLILLDTDASSEIVRQLRRISLHEGRIIYHWKPDVGLHPIHDPAMAMPATESLAAAMKTLEQQPYRSICVVDSLQGLDFGLLQQHAWKRHTKAEPAFSLLLLLPEHSIPTGMRKILQVVHWSRPSQVQPRLRDGRWLL